MPDLKEISVKFGGAAVDLEYAVRTFVSNHPSNPTISMQLVDHTSYGDESTKQKHKPDEILEEEPSGSNKQQSEEILEEEPSGSNKQQSEEIRANNYDKIFERIFERPRISRSPLSEEKKRKISRSLSEKKNKKISSSFKSSSLLRFPGIMLKKGFEIQKKKGFGYFRWGRENDETIKGRVASTIGRDAPNSPRRTQLYTTSRPSQ